MEAEIVDITRLKDLTDGSADELRELVGLYFEQTKGQITGLRSAIEERSAEKVRQLSHSCAGASATCGMVCIVPFLQQLEVAGRDNDLSGTPALLERTEAEFIRLQAFFQNYFAQLNP